MLLLAATKSVPADPPGTVQLPWPTAAACQVASPLLATAPSVPAFEPSPHARDIRCAPMVSFAPPGRCFTTVSCKATLVTTAPAGNVPRSNLKRTRPGSLLLLMVPRGRAPSLPKLLVDFAAKIEVSATGLNWMEPARQTTTANAEPTTTRSKRLMCAPCLAARSRSNEKADRTASGGPEPSDAQDRHALIAAKRGLPWSASFFSVCARLPPDLAWRRKSQSN